MKMETLTSLSEIYLMQVALKSMEKNLSETVTAAISFLGEIGVSSAEQIMEISTLEAAVILEDLGNAAVREKNESYAKAVIQALENTGDSGFSVWPEKYTCPDRMVSGNNPGSYP